jgi:hypothetical protein
MTFANITKKCINIQYLSQVCRRNSGAYSGGCVKLSADGETLACLFGGDVSFLDIHSGEVKRTLLKGDSSRLDPRPSQSSIVWFSQI